MFRLSRTRAWRCFPTVVLSPPPSNLRQCSREGRERRSTFPSRPPLPGGLLSLGLRAAPTHAGHIYPQRFPCAVWLWRMPLALAEMLFFQAVVPPHCRRQAPCTPCPVHPHGCMLHWVITANFPVSPARLSLPVFPKHPRPSHTAGRRAALNYGSPVMELQSCPPPPPPASFFTRLAGRIEAPRMKSCKLSIRVILAQKQEVPSYVCPLAPETEP